MKCIPQHCVLQIHSLVMFGYTRIHVYHIHDKVIQTVSVLKELHTPSYLQVSTSGTSSKITTKAVIEIICILKSNIIFRLFEAEEPFLTFLRFLICSTSMESSRANTQNYRLLFPLFAFPLKNTPSERWICGTNISIGCVLKFFDFLKQI